MPKQDRKRPEQRRDPKRVPLHEQKNVMTIDIAPDGMKRRWFYDDNPDKIARLELAGWKPVEITVNVGDEGATNQNQTLGTGARKQVAIDKRTGEPLYQILMEIPIEYYEADYAVGQAKEDKKMEALTERLHNGELAFTK